MTGGSNGSLSLRYRFEREEREGGREGGRRGEGLVVGEGEGLGGEGNEGSSIFL